MSKNTESVDTTNVCNIFIQKTAPDICSDTLDQLTNKDLFRIKYNYWRSSYLAVLFFFC